MKYKVKFYRKDSTKEDTSYGYYKDEEDFKRRNPTLKFSRMTNIKEKTKEEEGND